MAPQPLTHCSIESSQRFKRRADSDLPEATNPPAASVLGPLVRLGVNWEGTTKSGAGLLGSGHLSENLADLFGSRAIRIQLERTLEMYFGLNPVLSFLVNKA